MNDRSNKIRIKSVGYLLIPAIFLVFVYISYGVIIQGFVSTELQYSFNLKQNILPLLNIPIFVGMCFGVYISHYKVKNKKLFYSFLLFSIIINFFYFFIKKYIYFLIIRFISGIGFGCLFGYLSAYYYYYRSELNIKNVSLEWGKAFGVLLAALSTYYLVPFLGWNFAFFILLVGIFIIIMVSFLPEIEDISYLELKSFSKEKKTLLYLFMGIYFIIGNNYYIITLNIKNILVHFSKDYVIVHFYLILFSISIIFGYLISIYLYNKFSKFFLIFSLNLLLIFISFISIFAFSGIQIAYFLLLNIAIQIIIWNTVLVYSLTFFDPKERYIIIKSMFFMISFGGICSSIFSFLLNTKLSTNIFIFIGFTSLISLILTYNLSKKYNRYNHFMKR
ncbi:MFS transporter [Marinitoga aeolica]|uniref:MFS transporter n=1 Tax=Marinitoga aeolica TaxID=2809031 RepID=A0ABY8PPB4_9BACT|nr:MFS transporter [Marinitoga aeolica]WGS64475.1 hypothetical protein JRV97_08840 [Marinitoga aeolica]